MGGGGAAEVVVEVAVEVAVEVVVEVVIKVVAEVVVEVGMVVEVVVEVAVEVGGRGGGRGGNTKCEQLKNIAASYQHASHGSVARRHGHRNKSNTGKCSSNTLEP
jgi:hypothetical protein